MLHSDLVVPAARQEVITNLDPEEFILLPLKELDGKKFAILNYQQRVCDLYVAGSTTRSEFRVKFFEITLQMAKLGKAMRRLLCFQVVQTQTITAYCRILPTL